MNCGEALLRAPSCRDSAGYWAPRFLMRGRETLVSEEDTLAVVQAIWRLYGGDLSGFKPAEPAETPPEIDAWLARKPATAEVQGALVAILAELARRGSLV